jgi:hypothetical protein
VTDREKWNFIKEIKILDPHSLPIFGGKMEIPVIALFGATLIYFVIMVYVDFKQMNEKIKQLKGDRRWSRYI